MALRELTSAHRCGGTADDWAFTRWDYSSLASIRTVVVCVFSFAEVESLGCSWSEVHDTVGAGNVIRG